MRLHVARTRLSQLVERARIDADYRRQLRDHPVETLVQEGLPYDVIEDFLLETGWQAEVTGYLLPGCANSCALSNPGEYPELF